MPRQNISVGSTANDGTGDTLRQAAQKINQTFIEIYNKFGDSDNLSPVVSFVPSGIEFNVGNTFLLTTGGIPTADRTILLDDASGTIVLDSAPQTLTNKTLVSPTINSPSIGTGINDSNDNEIIKLTPTASAVNEVTVINAATGNAPTLSATGTDTNIDLNLISKGTGAVNLDKLALSSVEMTTNGAASEAVSYIICNKATALAITLADGTVVGEKKIFTNKGAGTATVTPANFAQGVSFTVNSNDGVECIWDGDNWYVTS